MKEYTLKLSSQNLGVLAAGLGELPMKVARETFDAMNAQIAQQEADDQAKVEAAKAAAAATQEAADKAVKKAAEAKD